MAFLIFIFGLCIGSFLNCVIYRLEKDQSFISGRSFCPSCGHNLAWKDLIPVLSFIFLKGRCRYCKEPISVQYPAVELATALVFVLVFNFSAFAQGFGGSAVGWQFLNLVYLLTISSSLIVIFVFDLKHYLIPDEIVYSGIAVAFLYRLFLALSIGNWNLIGTWYLVLGTLTSLSNPLTSALLASAFFYIIYALSKGRAMGFGDVKLAFFMGLFLGFPKIIVALFLAFFSGALVGIILMAFNKKTLKSELPFAPFLVFGTFFALFFGQGIINYYFKLLL